ncbi:MAG TPA: class I SAM-dependent methyltransferase [Acidimicrobiales bacterium]|nr:class I SAM-dependent methyltransferase [Acidimicrobiales bacterium]
MTALSAKQRAQRVLPARMVERLDRLAFQGRRARIRAVRGLAGAAGFNIVKKDDYYSTLPVLSALEATRAQWDRPSPLVGLHVDVDAMRVRLLDLADRWEVEFSERAGGGAHKEAGRFGPGYPRFDARTLYYVLREHRPSAYLEVGSGTSTYYASLAAERNEAEGDPMRVTCIEPHPYPALESVPGIELVQRLVQDVDVEQFEKLSAGDVLFIDSSHALKVGSDVAYLFLEVLPRLNEGVLVHIHDVPFPYNTPYPADTWLFGERWPVYWNEAMIVQAFLAFNSAFEMLLSTPLIRVEHEAALVERFDDYVPVRVDPNPPSSLWLQRVA